MEPIYIRLYWASCQSVAINFILDFFFFKKKKENNFIDKQSEGGVKSSNNQINKMKLLASLKQYH
jgi:hypothetical protein